MLPIKDNVPRRHKPLATAVIIGINIIVYLYQARMQHLELLEFIYSYGMVPAYFREQLAEVFYTPLSSMFLHGGLGHLVGNMWMLGLFGNNVEDRMGKLSFVLFYLLSGLVAASVHVVFNLSSSVPTIGASGAVAGVMAAYVFLFPLARVMTVIPIFIFPYIISVPAIIFMAVWFLTQIYYGTINLAFGVTSGGIAWWAHIGGFIFGGVAYRYFLRRKLQYY